MIMYLRVADGSTFTFGNNTSRKQRIKILVQARDARYQKRTKPTDRSLLLPVMCPQAWIDYK